MVKISSHGVEINSRADLEKILKDDRGKSVRGEKSRKGIARRTHGRTHK